ncbi:MAG: type II toxin-antitoxin system VapC family toxin [SAR202 cluster bacterium]|nr:type II toxin-antitoxin system VapC family toxin [SAR202 cluster bacterium]
MSEEKKPSESEVVLDSSALLALINDEPGAERVKTVVRRSAISSVNLSEVVAKLCQDNFSAIEIKGLLENLPFQIIDFTAEQAVQAGLLQPDTKFAGLSLGDRACLVLARQLALPAMTTDRNWARLSLGIHILMVR